MRKNAYISRKGLKRCEMGGRYVVVVIAALLVLEIM
jgi:hypothetical protein